MSQDIISKDTVSVKFSSKHKTECYLSSHYGIAHERQLYILLSRGEIRIVDPKICPWSFISFTDELPFEQDGTPDGDGSIGDFHAGIGTIVYRDSELFYVGIIPSSHTQRIQIFLWSKPTKSWIRVHEFIKPRSPMKAYSRSPGERSLIYSKPLCTEHFTCTYYTERDSIFIYGGSSELENSSALMYEFSFKTRTWVLVESNILDNPTEIQNQFYQWSLSPLSQGRRNQSNTSIAPYQSTANRHVYNLNLECDDGSEFNNGFDFVGDDLPQDNISVVGGFPTHSHSYDQSRNFQDSFGVMPSEDSSPMDLSNYVGPKRRGHSAVIWGDFIVVFGGMDQMYFVHNDVWFFHIPTSSWSKVKNRGECIPTPRYLHHAVVHENIMYIAGGKGSSLDGSLDQLYAFSLSSHYWIQVCIDGTLPQLCFPLLCVMDDQLLIHGGIPSQRSTTQSSTNTPNDVESHNIFESNFPRGSDDNNRITMESIEGNTEVSQQSDILYIFDLPPSSTSRFRSNLYSCNSFFDVSIKTHDIRKRKRVE